MGVYFANTGIDTKFGIRWGGRRSTVGSGRSPGHGAGGSAKGGARAGLTLGRLIPILSSFYLFVFGFVHGAGQCAWMQKNVLPFCGRRQKHKVPTSEPDNGFPVLMLGATCTIF